MSLQVGDVITQVESVDEQWILGVVGGRRGIVPKNYISFFWPGTSSISGFKQIGGFFYALMWTPCLFLNERFYSQVDVKNLIQPGRFLLMDLLLTGEAGSPRCDGRFKRTLDGLPGHFTSCHFIWTGWDVCRPVVGLKLWQRSCFTSSPLKLFDGFCTTSRLKDVQPGDISAAGGFYLFTGFY